MVFYGRLIGTFLLILSLFFSHFSSAGFINVISSQDTIYGKVVSIADGDTFTMLLDNKTTIKVRLVSIDCPERKQPYSAVATRFLSDHIFGNTVKVVVDSKDRYGRSLGWVYYDGKNLNKELLKAGLAWHSGRGIPRMKNYRLWRMKPEPIRLVYGRKRILFHPGIGGGV